MTEQLPVHFISLRNSEFALPRFRVFRWAPETLSPAKGCLRATHSAGGGAGGCTLDLGLANRRLVGGGVSVPEFPPHQQLNF